ncbi:MAG: hypothetical protein WA109_13425 [Bellilinea sp.]
MDITILNCPQGQLKGAVNKITRSKGLKKRVGMNADPFLENFLNLDGEMVRLYSSWKKGRSEVYGVAASAAAASTRPAKWLYVSIFNFSLLTIDRYIVGSRGSMDGL